MVILLTTGVSFVINLDTVVVSSFYLTVTAPYLRQNCESFLIRSFLLFDLNFLTCGQRLTRIQLCIASPMMEIRCSSKLLSDISEIYFSLSMTLFLTSIVIETRLSTHLRERDSTDTAIRSMIFPTFPDDFTLLYNLGLLSFRGLQALLFHSQYFTGVITPHLLLSFFMLLIRGQIYVPFIVFKG